MTCQPAHEHSQLTGWYCAPPYLCVQGARARARAVPFMQDWVRRACHTGSRMRRGSRTGDPSLDQNPDGPHSTRKMKNVQHLFAKNQSVSRKAMVDYQAPQLYPYRTNSQEHAVPVPLTLTFLLLERGRRIYNLWE